MFDMQNSRDSSVWRSLAVAFGDGVAFGVGMKISQNAARRSDSTATIDATPVTRRLAGLEARMAALEHAPSDRASVDALAGAIEGRLEEYTRAIEGTRCHLQESVSALERKLDQDLGAQRQQLVALHREFAAAVAQIVEEQVANQLEARTLALEKTVEQAVEERLSDLRGQLAAKEGQIEDLRQKLADSDRNVLDIMLGMRTLCRQVADKLSHPQATAQPGESKTAPEPAQEAARKAEFGQSQTEGGGSWRIPLVTSFLLLTGGGLLFLHYL